jgi:hypothetical protein
MLKSNPELSILEIGTPNYLFPVYPGPCNYFPRHKNYVPNGKISTVTDIYGPPVIFIFNLFSPQSLSLSSGYCPRPNSLAPTAHLTPPACSALCTQGNVYGPNSETGRGPPLPPQLRRDLARTSSAIPAADCASSSRISVSGGGGETHGTRGSTVAATHIVMTSQFIVQIEL